jgi:DNA invertase Pin-like site-specific DNA recombinase
VSSNASEKASERLKRKFLEKAQKGDVGQGSRPFGWGEDKKTLHPKESRLLRKAVQDIMDGVSTREIARRWNAAGVATTRGKAWRHTNVRQVLRSPRLTGWRVHQFECATCNVVGTNDAINKHPEGNRPCWTRQGDRT